MTGSKRVARTLCIIASGLLFTMGVFHGSGINYVNELVQSSDTPELIKQIFPVLFILPTFQLVGFAIFAMIAAFMQDQANKILIPLSVFVLLDAVLAFYLNALIPGFILTLPAIIFMFVAYWNRLQAVNSGASQS